LIKMQGKDPRIIGEWLRHRRAGLCVVVALLAAVDGAPSRAATFGAVAVGACDRLGYASGYNNLAQARASALKTCTSNGDKSCRIILSIQGDCAAFAVSGPCGARGWANAAARAQAEETAIARCSLRGGRSCTIRRSICDGED
jgi:hypothetical protein